MWNRKRFNNIIKICKWSLVEMKTLNYAKRYYINWNRSIQMSTFIGLEWLVSQLAHQNYWSFNQNSCIKWSDLFHTFDCRMMVISFINIIRKCRKFWSWQIWSFWFSLYLISGKLSRTNIEIRWHKLTFRSNKCQCIGVMSLSHTLT